MRRSLDGTEFERHSLRVKMKAAICEKYTEPIRILEVDRPTPKDHEVLIRVRASAVTTGDWRVRSATVPYGFGVLTKLIFGFSGPRAQILGVVLAGEIESVGAEVTRFKKGDSVVAMTGMGFGGHAEYRCLPETGTVTLKPPKVSFEEAAAIPFGGSTALDYLRDKAKVLAGEKVLIYGASGSVGSMAVQIAKMLGAEVDAVCSGRNADFVQAFGASQVYDYANQDFRKYDKTYDVILDAVGSLSFSNCQNSLRPNGRLLLITAGLPDMLKSMWSVLSQNKKVLSGPAAENAKILQSVMDLVEEGKLKASIDRRFSLEQINEAYAYVGQRHKRGEVVLTL